MAATTVKGIIRGAKRILQSKDWVQGEDVSRDKSAFCARGALAVAAGAKFYFCCSQPPYPEGHYVIRWETVAPAYNEAKALVDEAAERLGETQDASFCDVVDYNDYPGRTLEEVLALFDDALAHAA